MSITQLESGADFAELARLEASLKDLWEGCIPWREAIEMVGAGDHPAKAELRRSWNSWSRKFEASQRAW